MSRLAQVIATTLPGFSRSGRKLDSLRSVGFYYKRSKRHQAPWCRISSILKCVVPRIILGQRCPFQPTASLRACQVFRAQTFMDIASGLGPCSTAPGEKAFFTPWAWPNTWQYPRTSRYFVFPRSCPLTARRVCTFSAR
jgi:hypothetical protein